MSKEFTQAIYDVMNDDATLTALLSTFNSVAAIFTTDPAPKGVNFPYIVSAGEVADVPFDTKSTDGREFTRDIRCYDGNNSGSAVNIETIAERVRTLFHRQQFTITGFGVIITTASGPIARDEEDVFGRIVTISVTAQSC